MCGIVDRGLYTKERRQKSTSVLARPARMPAREVAMCATVAVGRISNDSRILYVKARKQRVRYPVTSKIGWLKYETRRIAM